jgi:glycosyltransferase involved in cell wall biosynthesis
LQIEAEGSDHVDTRPVQQVHRVAIGPSLRVVQVIDSLDRPGGAEQSLAQLAPRLVDEGIDLHVAYLLERDGFQEDLLKAGVGVHSLAGDTANRRYWRDRAVDLIRTLRPAVVHTTLFEADLAGRRAAARTRVPCISSLVNTAYGPTESRRDGLSKVRMRAAQAADIITARRVSRFHAITEHVATVMSRRLLIPRSKIDVIRRGRDPELLGRRSAARRGTARRRLELEPETPLILAVGRQEPQKGFDVLLEALLRVRSLFPTVRVIVAGREGRASPALARLMSIHELAGTVRFLGARDDVADLMAAADVLAFTSLWEGAAGTLLEAMALECPIVASRLPPILEALDESTAELVTPGDAEDLARGLASVLSNPDEAAGRVQRALARFDEEFTIEHSARRTADLYWRVATA